MPDFAVDLRSQDGRDSWRTTITASNSGFALARAVLRANMAGIRLDESWIITVSELSGEAGQLKMDLSGTVAPQPKKEVYPAKQVCPMWPNYSGECSDCGHDECENHPSNRRT